MNPTPFPELDEVLDRFVRRVRLILGSNLVGVYLTSAFALGEGDGASDCDFLVVTEQEVTDGGEHELRRLHRDVFEWPGYWAHAIGRWNGLRTATARWFAGSCTSVRRPSSARTRASSPVPCRQSGCG